MSSLLDKPSFIGGTIATLIVGIIISIRRLTPQTYSNSRVKIFLDVLAGLAVLMVSGQIVLSARQNALQKESDRISRTEQAITEEWLQPNKMLADEADKIPQFTGSLYANNSALYAACSSGNGPDCAREFQQQTTAVDLFQRWENYLTLRAFDKTGDRVWISNFLQWAASPELRKLWVILKHNYKGTTQKLASLLFEYSDKENPRTAEQFTATSQKLVADPRFQQLVAENG